MRFTVSSKILFFLSIQALLVLAMGFFFLYNINLLHNNSNQISNLKDFQIQINLLKSYIHIIPLNNRDAVQKNLYQQINRAEFIAGEIQTNHSDLPEHLLKSLKDIKKNHIHFFRNALEELYDKYIYRQKLSLENNRILILIDKYNAKVITNHEAPPPLLSTELANFWYKIIVDKNTGQIKNFKKNISTRLSLSNDHYFKNLLKRYSRNLDKAVFNQFAIEDKLTFLQSTNARFIEVCQETISFIDLENQEKQLHFKFHIITAVIIAFLLTLFIWIIAAKYLHLFLYNQQNAMNSIQSGDYDYDLVDISNDELGDLMNFLKKVSQELKNTLHKQKKSEKDHKQIIENASDIIWEINSNFILTYINPAIETVLNSRKEDFIGTSIFEFLSGETKKDSIKLKKLLLNEKKFINITDRKVHCFSDMLTLETIAQPKHDSNGNFSGYYGISRNISNRKKEEIILKQSRIFLQSIINGVSDPMLVTDENYRINLMNKAAHKFSAISVNSEDLFCYNVSHGRTSPCAKEGYPCILEEVRETGKPATTRHSHRDASGKKSIMEARAYPRFDQHGTFIGIIETFRDISNQVETEKKLDKTKNFLDNIINSMPSTLIGVDKKGIVTQLNKEAEKQTTIPVQEIIGSPINQVFPIFNQYKDQINSSITNKTTYKTTQFTPQEDGELKCFEIVIYPLLTNDIEGAVIKVDDVSNLIQLEQKVTNTEKEKQGLQAQLFHAQKIESLGRLAGGIAHDFNNILTSIIGYCELLLLRLKKDNPDRKDVQAIHKAGKRAEDLTRQLLTFSRKQPINKVPLDLNQLVTDLVKMLTRMIGSDITLELNPQQEIPNIFADPGQIEQVIMNLAVNARDAMPDGGQLIIETSNFEITAKQTAQFENLKPGPYILLTISDTGQGIDRELQDKIFEPFFTTKEVGLGTGLGLATVFGIIKQHQGYIKVHSKINNGTIFKIFFPVSNTLKHQVPSPDEIQATGGTETILVVEDDPMTKTLLVNTLEPLGYIVLSALSGNDALKLVKNNPVDIKLLLTDIIMPGINGKELSEQLTNKYFPHLKVLYISGYSENILDSLKNNTESDFSFMQKPISPNKLAYQVRSLLDLS